ncbi:prepilin peptidase [Allostreptomyces psammosilenae]|uniref:Prepilin signal peptidase PulO-like enzyme (Type II secretory pathway) n=1 Tax=Allostreptomyces psammosilenae TaxID=1892865 RepID=A0A852ZRC2_9ACTN|nr:prepilin peptidase [Allostreptomyces psammosilenae]NYI04996.1 prepilin signal peptidase PulO-like enzyme (type II secretory pathway) [Allostreptomyces psammosilenae]
MNATTDLTDHDPSLFWGGLAALGWLLLCGLPLARADVREHRLPDRWTARAGTGVALLLGAAAGRAGPEAALGAGAGALALALWHLPGALTGHVGWGDVKLAPSTGALLGWFGWPAVVAGCAATALLAACQGAAALARGRLTVPSMRGPTRLPLGPAMLVGTALVAGVHLWTLAP